MRVAIVTSVLLTAAAARADVIQVTPGDDLRALLAAAEPGDEFVLAAGTYEVDGARTAISVMASAQAPVVVRSATGGRAVLARVGSAVDVLVIENSSNVTLRNLELVGGARGVLVGFSDDVVIDGCIIHGAAGEGIQAGVGNGTIVQNVHEGLRVSGNEIYDVGTGVRLGCDNVFLCSTPGARLTRNFIHDVAGSAIVFSDDGDGAIIARNAAWRLGGEGIVVTRGATIHNNIVIGSAGFALRALVGGSSSVGDLRIANNTAVGSNGVRIDAPQADVVLANNAIFATQQDVVINGTTVNVTLRANVVVESLEDTFVDAAPDGSALDVFPKAGSSLIGAGDGTLQPTDDFNGTPRGSSRDVGAYVFSASGNPGGTDDDAAGVGSDFPSGSGGLDTGGPAKSTEDCAATSPAWPALLALGALLSRRRRA